MSSAPLVKRIAVVSAVLGAIGSIVAGFYYGPASALSCALGAGVGIANFTLLARLVSQMLDDETPGNKKKRAAVLLGVKFLALATLVGVFIISGYVRAGAFMSGFSVFALSLVIGALTNTAPEEDTADDTDGDRKQ